MTACMQWKASFHGEALFWGTLSLPRIRLRYPKQPPQPHPILCLQRRPRSCQATTFSCPTFEPRSTWKRTSPKALKELRSRASAQPTFSWRRLAPTFALASDHLLSSPADNVIRSAKNMNDVVLPLNSSRLCGPMYFVHEVLLPRLHAKFGGFLVGF